MKTILLLSILTYSTEAKSSKCHTCIMGVCFRRTKLFDNVIAGTKGAYQITGQLALDKTNNILYFHCIKDANDYTIAYEINTDTVYTISNVSFSFAHAVDPDGDVYMSGATGVYKYHRLSKKVQPVLPSISHLTVWQMQYHDKLYYTTLSQKGLKVVHQKDDIRTILEDYKIEDFVIDKFGDIYFEDDRSFYRLKKGAKTVEVLANELIFILATDRNGSLYFAQTATSGLYRIDYSKQKVVRIGAFGRDSGTGTPYKFVFDSFNNIIYLDGDEVLYLLSPTYRSCKVSPMTGKRKWLTVDATNAFLALKHELTERLQN